MALGNVALNDGSEMPVVAYGTGTSLYGRNASDAVTLALDTGFIHIDTAATYGNEDSVGDAIRLSGLSRPELYITTKYDGGDIQDAVRTSLGKLGLSYVDLYLIHWPSLAFPNIQSNWHEFEAIKKDGLAKSVGVSNFGVPEMEQLMAIANVTPAVNQINFSPYNYAQHKNLLEYSAKYGIVTQAYASLSSLTNRPGGPVDAPVNAAAKRLNATPGQVLFSWVLSKDVVIVTTSSKEERLREYLAVGDLAPLTEEEISAIDAAGAGGAPSLIRVVGYHIMRSMTFQNVMLLVIFGILVTVGVRTWTRRKSATAKATAPEEERLLQEEA